MTATVRKTISLPPDLARDAEETARAEGKTLSAVVRDALRQTRATRLREELGALQDYGPSGERTGDPERGGPPAVSRNVKVVFDTNVFVSAPTLPASGPQARHAAMIHAPPHLHEAPPPVSSRP